MNRRSFIEACFGILVAFLVTPITFWDSLFKKKRRAWAYEGIPELRNSYNIQMERELTGLLSQEITREIDEEILGHLRLPIGVMA